MMGLGYLGSSASSASSNLSPLAPPFTVDRSNHNKSNFNSSPVSHFNDLSYGVPFNSSWPYSHSSTSTQEFLADSVRIASVPSANDYGFVSPEPINPPTNLNWSGLNSNVKTAMEPVGTRWSAVNPGPSSVKDSFSYNLGEAKPFYPPYVSSSNNDEILNNSNYDLLSASSLVSGCESFKVDYTQSLSGLEYNPQGGSIWSGPKPDKQKKRMETDDSFFLEEGNLAASLACKSYINQGTFGAETLSKGKGDSTMFYYAGDAIRREDNIGSSIMDKLDASLSPNNQGYCSEFSEGPTYRAFPMVSESPGEPLIAQNSFPSYEKSFHMFDRSSDCIAPSITRSSPSLVIKPPTVVSNYSAPGATSSKTMEIGNFADFKSNVVGNHNPSKEMELNLMEAKESFFASTQPSFQLGRTDEHATKEETPTKMSANDWLNFEFKARPSFQVLSINIPNVNNTESVKSVANSFEHSDHLNPAEDSPCWKGAPTSYFSPFASPEPESPQHPTKKLQISNSVNSQESETALLFNNSSRLPSSELVEIGESNERTAPHEKEHMNIGLDSAKSNIKGGILNESTSDANSQTFQLKLPYPQKDDSSKMKIHRLCGDMEHTIDVVENVLVSSVEDAANLAAEAKLNTNVIVKALNNLSDLLLLHCSNDGCMLTEQDRKSLHHVVGNLDVCMSGKLQHVAPTQKSISPQQNSSNISQEDPYFGKSQRRNDDILGKNVEKLLGSASLRDEADLRKDHNMIQAIKKVLDENLECKEELPSQIMLYKNLWLEAEAELCAFNYKARFDRMNRDMGKWKSHKSAVSDAPEITFAKKIMSSNGSPDLNTSPGPIHETDDSKVSDLRVQNHSFWSVDNHVGDVEASVMARFCILKHRGELVPVDVGEQQLAVDQCVESQGSGATVQPHMLDHLCKGRNGSSSDVEPSAVARFNMGESNPVDDVEKQAAEVSGHKSQSSPDRGDGRGLMQNQFKSGSYSSSDWEHILKDEFCWHTNGRLN